MRRAIGSIQDHYVVCGHGRTARPVVAALREEKIPFVVVDRDPEQARLLREEGILAVHGDATDEAVLEEAGLPRARGLLALLPSDADNLYLSMAAKGAREDVRVIARASDEKAEAKLRRVGADEVVLPYRIAGQRVLQAITQPHVVEFLDTLSRRAEMAMGLEEIRLGARSSLVGATLDEACRRERAGAIVVGLRRHGEALRFNPDRGERLQAGDVLLALGPPDDLRRLEALAADGAR